MGVSSESKSSSGALLQAVIEVQDRFIRFGRRSQCLQMLLDAITQSSGSQAGAVLFGASVAFRSGLAKMETPDLVLPFASGRGAIHLWHPQTVHDLEPALRCCGTLLDAADEESCPRRVCRAALDATSDGIVLTDSTGKVTYLNQRFRSLWDLSEEMTPITETNSSLNDLFPDGEAVIRRTLHAADDDPSLELESEIELKDGRVIEIFSKPCVLDDGSQARVWTMRNITERHRALSAYRVAKERLELGLTSKTDTVFDWNMLTGEVYSSGLQGIQSGASLAERIHPDDVQRAQEAIENAINSGQPYDIEYRTSVSERGQYEWIRVRGNVVRDQDGLPVRMIGWSTNITERREIMHALEVSEARYRNILSQVKEVVFEATPDLHWRFLSPAWQRCTGFEVGASVGRPMLDFVHPEDRRLMNDYVGLLTSRVADQPEGIEIRWFTAAGETRWLRCNISAAVDENGAVAGLAGTVLDVHERRIAEQEREKALREAEIAHRARSEFLATVSHEIRTPLNGIIGACELLSRFELPSQQSEYLRIAQSSSTHLLRLIDDLLDISKIEAGQLDINNVRFDPLDLLDEVCHSFRERMRSCNLAFRLVLRSELPQMSGDSHRIHQILSNLLANALKFTEEGSVELSAGVSPVSGGDSIVRFTVSDTGPGIPANKQSLIFERFVQLETNMTRREAGAGLGLAIGRLLAERMGGRLWVQSEPGQGSAFHLELPLAVAGPSLITNANLPPVVIRCREERLRQTVELLSAAEGRKSSIWRQSAPKTAGLVVAEADSLRHSDWKRLARLAEFGVRCMVIMAGKEAHEAPPGVDVIEQPLLPSLFRAALHAPRLSGQGEETSSVQSSSPRVLLAEDNEDNALLLKALLSNGGYDVDCVYSGAQAIEQASRFRYDLVLMDVEMPEVDGLEATARIRSLERRERRPRMPIVALTAHALGAFRDRCFQAGMDDYLPKPVQLDGLMAATRKWIDWKPVILTLHPSENADWVNLLAREKDCHLLIAADIAEAASILASRRVNLVLVSARQKSARLMNALRSAATHVPVLEIEPNQPLSLTDLLPRPDSSLNRRIAMMQPRYIANRFAELSALRRALEDGDYETIRRTGHNLKGSAKGYGLPELGEIGRDLEEAAGAGEIGKTRLQLDRLARCLEALTVGGESPRANP